MKNVYFVIPLLAAVVLLSGCSIFPGSGGGTGVKVSDVIVLKSLDVYPSTTVKSNQDIRIVTYVENQGSEKIPLQGQTGEVIVNLFDYCADKFDITVNCAGTTTNDASTCNVGNLLPKESKEVSWVLRPKNVGDLGVSCDLKASVEYSYKTRGETSISFINSQEMQRQIERGEFRSVNSQTNKGNGPVKVFVQVEDRQPIPTSSTGTVPIVLKVVNEGRGFVVGNNVSLKSTNILGSDFYGVENCLFDDQNLPDKNIELRKGIRELSCDLNLPQDDNVVKEITKFMDAEIEYNYEFRSNIKVTVKP